MTLKSRRPYYDDVDDGYMESDDEYFQYNLEATRVFFDGGLEKFAELIVQECLNKIDEVGYKSSNNISAEDTELFKNVLKSHFRVK